MVSRLGYVNGICSEWVVLVVEVGNLRNARMRSGVGRGGKRGGYGNGEGG